MKKKKTKLLGAKVPKLRAPKLPLSKIPLKRFKRGQSDAKLTEALQNLPRITNETVAEHREEVLGSARKYIYPLNHSKRRVLVITTGLLIAAIVLFSAYCLTALYKLHSTSTFVYGVTQVIPFPVAKAGPSWVSYESYLFELRHTMHYYQNQAQPRENFNDPKFKAHLIQLKKQALQQVIEDAYVKQVAKQHHISVSTAEVNDQVALVRSQNRLGSNDQVFRSVLSEFWGWTVDDFKRELKQQLLAQKVVTTLDTKTQARAVTTLAQLKAGTDFATLAAQVSDDASTKANGGNYGIAIDQSNRDIAPKVTSELFKLKAGEYSGIINTGYSLEIDKVIDAAGSKVHAAHIVFNFKPLNTYISPLQAKHKPHTYIKVN